MAIWDIGRSPFSGDTQEVGSFDPTLWEAGKEPQVMGANPGDGPASLTTHPNTHALTHRSAWKWNSRKLRQPL